MTPTVDPDDKSICDFYKEMWKNPEKIYQIDWFIVPIARNRISTEFEPIVSHCHSREIFSPKWNRI